MARSRLLSIFLLKQLDVLLNYHLDISWYTVIETGTMARFLSDTMQVVSNYLSAGFGHHKTSEEREHTQVVSRTTGEPDDPLPCIVASIQSRSTTENPSVTAEIGRTKGGSPLCIPRVLDTSSGNTLRLTPYQNDTMGNRYHSGRSELYQRAHRPGISIHPTQYGSSQRGCGQAEFSIAGIRHDGISITGIKFRQHQHFLKSENKRRQADRKLQSAQCEISRLQARLEGFTEPPVPPIRVIADPESQTLESIHDDVYYSMKFLEIRTKIREWVVQSFFTRGSNPVDNLFNLDERELNFMGLAKLQPGLDLLESPVLICGSVRVPYLPDSKTLRYLIQAYVATILHKHVLGPFLPGMLESTIETLMGEWMNECSFRDRIKWKLNTVELITKTTFYNEKVTKITQRVALDIVRCLAPLGKSGFNIEGRARALGKIFTAAASIILELRQEPNDFEVPYLGRGTCCTGMPVSDAEGKISDEDLQCKRAGNEFILQLVIFPPLVRTASQDLERAVLANAQVLAEEALL
ncbi:hypothetical protein L211DRAFT_866902 [Terfezia boudieri ATCC MYA-4762]|uniref:Uncharacterized protein n=1 Tax=Terfezia boudieri ATCC MYA-4762 TaxID=1051890 RepID=A0A3N4M7K1_9PEZI|nr:hypothetical protein L211DRAFT_866902 [Terfezia boudieri ATCC MYA-4762]